MRKSFKRIAVLLVIALLAPLILPCIPTMKGLIGTEVYAASKNASLNMTNTTVGVYSSPEYISINHQKPGATYTMTSKNKKIAMVKNRGIIGISKGKTTITVTEKYKGKTKTVGNVTVSVAGPKFEKKEITLGIGGFDNYIPILYYNKKAKYTFECSDSSIVKIYKDGYVVGVKFGTTTVSVTESYKGKTTKLGSMKITVALATIDRNTESYIYIYDYDTLDCLLDNANIKNFNEDAVYTAVSADPTIVEIDNRIDYDGQILKLKGLKAGTTIITIYEEYMGIKKLLGTVNIEVKENPVESFELYDDEDATQEYYLDEILTDWRKLSDLFDIEPYDNTTPITYVSSNDNIVKVDNKGYVIPISEGTAKITVSCGRFTQEITINVSDSKY